MAEFRLDTARLRLRSWREEDLAPFHEICRDPVVMATLGPPLTRDETRQAIARSQAQQDAHGHCFWALERREDSRLIGWCGVIRGRTGPVAGKVEAGWRLASDCWGQGYASEGARAALDWAFAHLGDDAVYAITSTGNLRSRAVMERMGMRYRRDLDFAHPDVPEESQLRPHVTYCIVRGDYPGS